jgi:hypothetical protein
LNYCYYSCVARIRSEDGDEIGEEWKEGIFWHLPAEAVVQLKNMIGNFL